MTARRTGGFTLIEVLVALAIFGVVTVLSYMTIAQLLDNTAYLGSRMDRLQAVQRTIQTLASDFTQSAPRPVRDEFGENYLPAVRTTLATDFALEITRGGWMNPAGLQRGTLQRSAYRIEEGELIRYHWNVLDRTFANEARATVLLDDVESLTFRYLDSGGQWGDQWPSLLQQGPGGLKDRPRAVEIVLTLADEGEVTRLIEVAP